MGRLSAIFDHGSGAEQAVSELRSMGLTEVRVNDGKGDTGSGFLGGQASNRGGAMVVEADVPEAMESQARGLMERCGGRVYGGSDPDGADTDSDDYLRFGGISERTGVVYEPDRTDHSGMGGSYGGTSSASDASGYDPASLGGDEMAGMGQGVGGSSGMSGMTGGGGGGSRMVVTPSGGMEASTGSGLMGSGSAGGMTGSRGAGGAGMAAQIREHMMVHAKGGAMMGVSGTHVGTVDKIEGDQIKLTRSDAPDGLHHYIPLSWVERVDAEGNAVMLSVEADEVRRGWR